LYCEIKKGNPIYGAPIDPKSFYESDSLEKLEIFLDFQLGEEKLEFITFLYNLLNKESGKTNCLNLIGAPSSGKTYFARIVKEALVVSGMIANMNNRCNFPFQNCINKRVLL
jgi:hypothetical protein